MKRRRVLFIKLSQFRIFLRKFVVMTVVFAALGLVVLSKTQNTHLSALQKSISKVLNPVIQIIQLPVDGVHIVYDKIRDVVRVYQENEALKKQNELFEINQSKLQTLKLENKLLAEMLNYTPPKDARFITAKVISAEGDGFSHSLTVFIAGAKDLKKGEVVLHQANVIGRIDEINDAYARVLLITDISSKIPVLIERTNTSAILSGNNTDTLNLLYVNTDKPPLVGDKIVTSGVGGIFESGLNVGRVVSIEGNNIKVKPFADIESVQYVRIVDYGLSLPLLSSEDEF